MGGKQLRLGSITLLFTVILLCVAALAALSAATAHADLAVTEKYRARVQDMYAAESAGQEWLAAVDAAIAAKGAALTATDLPAGTSLDGDVLSAQLVQESGCTLSVSVRRTESGYTILRWENTAQWTEDTDIGSLWTGGAVS
jgi:hypothetical protein